MRNVLSNLDFTKSSKLISETEMSVLHFSIKKSADLLLNFVINFLYEQKW